jgi:hypothetical protein
LDIDAFNLYGGRSASISIEMMDPYVTFSGDMRYAFVERSEKTATPLEPSRG